MKLVEHRRPSGRSDDALIGVSSAAVPATLAFGLLALIAGGPAVTAAITTYLLALALLVASVAVSTGSIALRLSAPSPWSDRPGPATRVVIAIVAAIAAAWWFWSLMSAVGSGADDVALAALVLPPIGLIVLNGTAAGVHRSPAGVLATCVAPGAALVFLGVVATVIRVSIASPLPLSAGQAMARLEFSASAGVGYDVRVGGSSCDDGNAVAAGSFGPGIGSPGPSVDRDRIVVEVARSALPAPRNIVRVCVRDGFRLGSATATLDVDDLSPAPPTVVAEPAGGTGGVREATSRHLRLSGTAEPGTTLEIRLDDGEFAHPRVVAGQWEAQWWVASSRLAATAQAISRDRAGNETRSPTLHIRFVGNDPPGVPALGHPAVLIECRAALATLSPAICAELGGAEIDRALQLESSTHRIVLTDDDEGCAAVFLDRRDRLVTYNRFDCPDGP